MKRYVLSLVLALTAVQATAKARDCGPTVANLYGDLVVSSLVAGTVQISWDVLEDPTVREYRVSRYNCRWPSRCSVQVARVLASGPSPTGASRTYSIADVAPPGLWMYRLEVVRSGSPKCIREVPVVVPPLSCDVSLLCKQMEEHFVGEVIAGEVTLRWSSSMESAAMGYRLVRFDRNNPVDQVDVAMVMATGSCGEVVERSFSETPPAGEWGYRLEVFGHGGTVACRVESSR